MIPLTPLGRVLGSPRGPWGDCTKRLGKDYEKTIITIITAIITTFINRQRQALRGELFTRSMWRTISGECQLARCYRLRRVPQARVGVSESIWQ